MNIGIDIVECKRVAGLISDKVFSVNELKYIHAKHDALPTVAGLFAAKEAYFKAKGTGIIKSELPKVEVGHHAGGQPFYVNDSQCALSISHTEDTAVAVCINFQDFCLFYRIYKHNAKQRLSN